MNCHTVQNLLSAFVDCELDNDQKRDIRKHLFLCTDCQYEYQHIRQLKKYLGGFYQEPVLNYDPLQDLYARLNEEKKLLPPTGQFLWSHRIMVVAACLIAFFLSTFMLFPLEQRQTALAKRIQTQETYDRNFSIDQPVTVYQASLVLP